MSPDKDPNIEKELRDLGSHVEYPPTPDLASAVRGRLEAEGGSDTPRFGPSLWWLAAAALVLLAALPVVSPTIRGMGSGASSGGASGTEVAAPTRGDAEQAPVATSAPETSPPLAAGAESAAACAYPEPYVEILPDRGPPGTRLTVRGGNFIDARSTATRSCDDTGTPDARAGGRLLPSPRVPLVFRQDGEVWRLGVAEPGRGLGFRAEVRVPDAASPGRATVVGEGVVGRAEQRFLVTPGER